ncbi:hypothetical protein R2360_13670 [Mycobacteroides chelonae]|nr:hypothetical protein [Mycobacteroides chelonae]MEC4843337.1 hypothetical protein [Mycobacteroides chelonae]
MAPIDLDLFHEHTRGRGMVEVLLRGHLWLENALDDLITAEVKNPTPLSMDRMRFASKVNLVEALGLLGQSESQTLREINKIRNRLAHDLHGEPTLDDLSRLEQGLSKTQQRMADRLCQSGDYRKPPADPDHMIRLCMTLLALLVDIEWRRQRLLYQKANRTSIVTFGVIEKIDRQFGRKPKTWEEWRKAHNVPPPPDPMDVIVSKP